MTRIILFSIIFTLFLLSIIKANSSVKSRKLSLGLTSKTDEKSVEEFPDCEISRNKKNFVSEICGALQYSPEDGTVTALGYCNCPRQKTCSSNTALDDPFTYAIIDNIQYKSCISKSFTPECPIHEQDYTVAKVWYGEELPLRVLVHCRCPSGYSWGELQCTSSGRICYVMECEKFIETK